MIQIAVYAIFALWILAFIFPPVIVGSYANHNAVRIARPVGPLNSDGSTTKYVHVQETGEFRLHKLFALAAGIPFLLVEPSPVTLFLMPIVMMGADQATRTLNAIDYAGHGAEILVAEADGMVGYRAAEIERMSDDRDKRGQNVEAELTRWNWLAVIVATLGKAR